MMLDEKKWMRNATAMNMSTLSIVVLRVDVYLSTYEVVVNLLRMLIRDIAPVELYCIRCGANKIY